MLLKASKNWKRPYSNSSQIKKDLKVLVDEKLLGRQEIPSIGSGRSAFLYFLKPRACQLILGLDGLSRRNSLFRGFTEAPWHTLASSEFCAELERSAGECRDAVKILAVLRPRQFEAKVVTRTRRGEDFTSLIPDYTQVIAFNKMPRLFFLEIQNRTPVIMPVGERSLSRSFQFKLTRYKAFAWHFREHHLIQKLEESFSCRFDKFQVLVVTTRGDAHLRNLMMANQSPEYEQMFLFTTLKEASQGNVFSTPMWHQAGVKTAALM
jgi:hypothetical protein